MSANRPLSRSDAAIAGAGILIVLCCVAGPAVLGVLAGSVIGGWLGIVCAVTSAAAIALVVRRRTSRRGGR
ncbi:MAG: hypothetical protein QOJ35_1359 [Solirubrobacteraceae bacterium]|jgi:hypothetical protein|nr:hypothetical protein [Solirubrobacteraceae bacterium]